MSDLAGLYARQNADGGWPYWKGSSWTEPTVYALLALASSGDMSSPAVDHAFDWLSKSQREDGGWAPRRLVEESTWVTAAVLLLPSGMLPRFNAAAALNWLLAKTGRESSWIERVRAAMISGHMDPRKPDGWPWFPDTAAWVGPTAFSILALRKASKRDSRQAIADRIQQGQEFLLSRRCADGGWNHGSSKALGYDGPSYPETTGLALLALRGLPRDRVERGIAKAEEHLRASRSVEAISWLRLGLLAHARHPEAPPVTTERALSTQEVALAMIAGNTARDSNILEA